MPSSDERANLVDTCPETRESEIQPLSVRQGSISPWTNAASWDKSAIRRVPAERRVGPRTAVCERPEKDAETGIDGV